jgi:hypothetical protein
VPQFPADSNNTDAPADWAAQLTRELKERCKKRARELEERTAKVKEDIGRLGQLLNPSAAALAGTPPFECNDLPA